MNIVAVPMQQKQHKHLQVQQNPKGPTIINSPVIRPQALMMQKPSPIGLISQRTTTGPQIISVRGMAK